MTYELRNPQASDLFVVTRIIKVIGLKNVADCFNNDEIKAFKDNIVERGTPASDEEMRKVGLMAITSIGELIFEKLDIVQDDIYKFLSNLSGLTVDEVASMDIVEFAEMFMTVIKNPKFADFIKVVLKSFK